MTETILRILHISDLHFCEQHLAQKLDGFREEVKAASKNRVNLDIHKHSTQVLEALRDWIQQNDPDVLMVTGDITTFGDSESFKQATQWFQTLRMRPNGQDRRCIVVPGNHDALIDHFSAWNQTFRGLSLPLRLAARLSFRKLVSYLDDLGGSPYDSKNFLKNYYTFIEANKGFVKNTDITEVLQNGQTVQLLPVDTVSRDPAWVNTGEPTSAAWGNLNRLKPVPGRLLIVATHHNPIPSPHTIQSQITHAYNSMGGGTRYLKRLQQGGCDLICFGHEHERCLYSLDFDLSTAGHAYALGCPASSVKDGGINLLEIQDINHVRVTACKCSDQGGIKFVTDAFFPTDGVGGLSPTYELTLEHNRPTDVQTRSARLEIKAFSEDERHLFDELGSIDSELVYICGRHLKDLHEGDFNQLEKIISSKSRRTNSPRRLRILLSNPDLLDQLIRTFDETPTAKQLLGDSESLRELASSVKSVSSALKAWINGRSQEERQRIDLRYCYTLIPFGAYAADPDKPWGKIVLKLLPLGAIKSFNTPCMRLNKRRDNTLFSFYMRHLKYLISNSERVGGDWTHGDEDLNLTPHA